jgi:hypothetical protein
MTSGFHGLIMLMPVNFWQFHPTNVCLHSQRVKSPNTGPRTLCPVHSLTLAGEWPTYLPQFHLYGGVELHEPSVEIELLRLRLVDAHICSLCRKFAYIFQVLAQFVAQLSELCLAVVLQTEGKCLQDTKWSNGTYLAYQEMPLHHDRNNIYTEDYSV